MQSADYTILSGLQKLNTRYKLADEWLRATAAAAAARVSHCLGLLLLLEVDGASVRVCIHAILQTRPGSRKQRESGPAVRRQRNTPQCSVA